MGRAEERAFERRWWILFALCFSLLVIVLDNTILNVAIPTIVRELDATNSQLQWIVDSYVLVFAGLLLTAGALGDRFGRRPALQLGLVLFGIGSVASAYSTSADMLIATRAFMGIGGAFIMPATLSIITNVFPGPERGKAIGVWAGTAGIAGALGPLAGGFLLEHFYWGSVFLVNVPIVIFGLIAGSVLIPNSKDPSAPKLDPVGAVLSIVGLTALLYAIIEAPNNGWAESGTLFGFAAGIGLLLVFALWELHSSHPMLDMRLFKNARFSAASLSIGAVFFAMFGSIFLITQYFQFILGYTPLQAGVRLLPFAAVMMVTAPSSAKIVERFGTKLVVSAGLLCVAISLGTFVGLDATSPYGQSAWRMMLMAFGMGLTMAPATESIMSALPLAKAGVGSAVNDTVRQVGGALGVAVIGSVYSSVYVSQIGNALDGSSIPAAGQAAAKNSIGGALGVAASSAERGFGDFANTFALQAKEGFVTAMHRGIVVGAVVALLGSIMAYVWLPARPRSQDIQSQAAEFEAESFPSPEPA